VWIALASFLKSRIHIDDYRSRIYGSLSTLNQNQLEEIGLSVPSDNRSLRESGQEIREAPALCGFRNGNHIQPGCLTSRENARIHSCERGMNCQVIENDTDARIVHIIPIVSRFSGSDIAEIGAGGGQGDLDQKEELETGTTADVGELMKLCAASIEDEVLCSKVLALLQPKLHGENGKLEISSQTRKQDPKCQDDLSLPSLVSVLSSRVSSDQITMPPQNRTIRFPYSRHSSFSELCELLAAFRPSDVYPCTVDCENWTPAVSMRNLFRDFCCDDIFRHDAEMTMAYEVRQETERNHKRERPRSQSDTDASGDNACSPDLLKRIHLEEALSTKSNEDVWNMVTQSMAPDHTRDEFTESGKINKDMLSGSASTEMLEHLECTSMPWDFVTSDRPNSTLASAATESVSDSARLFNKPNCDEGPTSRPRLHEGNKRPKLTHQELAYNAAIGCGLTWDDYGGLVSTRCKADQEEQEL